MYRRYSPTNQTSPNPHQRQPQNRPTPENHQHTQHQQHAANQQPNTSPQPQHQKTNKKQNQSSQRTVKRQQHPHTNVQHFSEKPSVPSKADNPSVASIKKETATQSNGITGLLSNLIPKGLYNPETKKIMGILSSEDLLLIALIFIFLENNTEDNPIIALALLYVLLSDYIDLGDFSF